MASVLVVYGSTTGKTEATARIISDTLSETFETTLKNVIDTSIRDIGKYDLVLFGCSTWGDGDTELQDDFHDLFQNLDQAPLSGKKVAAFGCGDRSYINFCGAVDTIEKKVKEHGGTLICEGLRVGGEPDDYKEAIVSWTRNLAVDG